MADAARQVDARTGTKRRVARWRPDAAFAFENVDRFFVGVMVQRRAARRDDADELRDAAGPGLLIDEQLESSVAGRYCLLISFAYSAQRFGIERRGADGFDRLRIVFGTAHADDDEC